MTEQRGDSVIDVLRNRFGPRHYAGIDQGRADLIGALCDDLGMDRDQAEALVRQMVDDGRLRYVTADERDPELDRAAQSDERGDRANTMRSDNPASPEDSLGLKAIPPTGGPQEGYSGLATGTAARAAGAAIPVAGTGTGATAGPLAVAASDPGLGAGNLSGYWDIGGGASGVVPSTTRKGQVEPRGT